MKDMKKIFAIAAGFMVLASCAEEMTPVQENDNTVIIEAILPGQNTPLTKVVLTEGTNSNDELIVHVDWAASGESFSVMTASSPSPQTFTQFGPTSFKGELPEESGKYYAFYPTTISKKATSVDYDFDTQRGTLGNNNPYMFASSWGGTIYYFQHLTALVKLTVNMPDGHVGTPTKILVSSDKIKATGSIDLTTAEPTFHGAGNIITLPAQAAGQSSYTVYMYVNPMVASEDNLTTFNVEIPESDARYSGSFSTSKTIERGKVYEASLDLAEVERRLEDPTDLFIDQIDGLPASYTGENWISAYILWKDNNTDERGHQVYKKLAGSVVGDRFVNNNLTTIESGLEIDQFDYLRTGDIINLGVQALSKNLNEINNSNVAYSRTYRVLSWEELQEYNADYWQDEPDTWTGVYRECIAPEKINVVANNNGSITMEWYCGSAAEVGFNLYARPVSETAWHKEHLKTSIKGQFDYTQRMEATITGLTSGTYYILGVQTMGETGARNSNIISFYNTNPTAGSNGSVKAN